MENGKFRLETDILKFLGILPIHKYFHLDTFQSVTLRLPLLGFSVFTSVNRFVEYVFEPFQVPSRSEQQFQPTQDATSNTNMAKDRRSVMSGRPIDLTGASPTHEPTSPSMNESSPPTDPRLRQAPQTGAPQPPEQPPKMPQRSCGSHQLAQVIDGSNVYLFSPPSPYPEGFETVKQAISRVDELEACSGYQKS